MATMLQKMILLQILLDLAATIDLPHLGQKVALLLAVSCLQSVTWASIATAHVVQRRRSQLSSRIGLVRLQARQTAMSAIAIIYPFHNVDRRLLYA